MGCGIRGLVITEVGCIVFSTSSDQVFINIPSEGPFYMHVDEYIHVEIPCQEDGPAEHAKLNFFLSRCIPDIHLS